MRIRSLDESGDWIFGNGKSSYKESGLALAQNIKTRLLEWKTDCFFNNDAGVDWKNRLDKPNQIDLLRDEIRSVILKTDGVSDLLNLESKFINRKLSVSYLVNTVYSKQPISENIIV